MQVNSANSTSNSTQQGGTVSSTNQVLGKDDFLQLLVTQLKYQDINSQQDESQTIAQMAQFSELEQMQNLNKSITSMMQIQTSVQAIGMIGKTATAVNPDTGENVTGQITGVEFSEGVPFISIGDTKFTMENLAKVE